MSINIDLRNEDVAKTETVITDAERKEIEQHLSDRWWRMNNLYYIKDRDGNKILFQPKNNTTQTFIHDNLWFRVVIPKARQLGVTTFFTILYFDQILFSENKTAAIIAHDDESMERIFVDKIRFAWDNLPTWLKKRMGEPNTDRAKELSFQNGGKIFVSTSTRSTTVQFLHISEFGKINAKYPNKAEEIVSGSFNSVSKDGIISIESTAEGQEGYFYKYTMDADEKRRSRKKLSRLDFRLMFFPWYLEPSYTLDDEQITITEENSKYFSVVEAKENITLTKGQKRWYVKKLSDQGRELMNREFPSTLEEAFSATTEGQIFANEITRLFEERRVRSVHHDPRYPVHTLWDLGQDDFTVILLYQAIEGNIKFIDMYWARREGLEHYYTWLARRRDERGYRYGNHHFPHDIKVSELQTGNTRYEFLRKLGMTNMKVGERPLSVADDIETLRPLFARIIIDETRCKRLAEAITAYRRDWDKKLGRYKDAPLHNEASHFVDPLRLLPQFWKETDEQYDINGEKRQGVTVTSVF